MIVCVRICPIVSAYIFRHKTISLLREDLYHTSYTDTFVEIPSAPSAPQGTTMREPSFVDHMAASIVSADSMHAKVEDHRVIATPSHRLQQPPIKKGTDGKKSQQLAYVAIDFICFYLTIESFENETSIFCRNYHQKKNTKQLGDTTCF